jgi:hypothetical protein
MSDEERGGDDILVTLTETQFRTVASFGALVVAAHRIAKHEHNHGLAADKGWTEQIDGFQSEEAVASWFGIYPNMRIGKTRKENGETFPDVGPFDVRSTRHLDGRLILHDDDPDSRPFILVTGTAPYDLHMRGWIRARDGKLKKYESDPVGGRPAFWVPPVDLHPMRLAKVRYVEWLKQQWGLP